MGPYARAVLSVIRLAAGGILVLGLVQTGSLLFVKDADKGVSDYLIKGWPAVIGILLFIFGGKIARAVTRNLED